MSLLDTLLPSAAVDYVGIFDEDGFQIFREARPLKVRVNQEARVMQHPVENGTVVTDHRVLQPIEIELSLIAPSEEYRTVYENIRQYYLNATLLFIHTRTGIYANQLISSMPHEEDPSLYDAITIALKTREVQFVEPVFTQIPQNPSNQNTIKRGTQQGKAPEAKKSSAVLQGFNAAIGGS